MGHSSYDPVEQGPAWNAGKKLGAKRPLKPKEIWEMRPLARMHGPMRLAVPRPPTVAKPGLRKLNSGLPSVSPNVGSML